MQKRLFFQGDYKFAVELPEQFSCNYHFWTRNHLRVGESDSRSSQAELGVDPGDISWLYRSVCCPSTGPLPLQRSGWRKESHQLLFPPGWTTLSQAQALQPTGSPTPSWGNKATLFLLHNTTQSLNQG